MADQIAAVNRLTRLWLERYEGGSGVLSGAGLWPLLAVLAASADEPGRRELADAVALPADDAMAAAQLVLSTIDDADGVDAALGIWAQQKAHVRPEWREELPPSSYGELTGLPNQDKPMLDAWARDRTRGLIEEFPVDVHPDLVVVLATAIALKTTWAKKFTDEPLTPDAGPWAGRQLAGLKRSTTELDDLQVVGSGADMVSLMRVEGDNGLDVYLALGDDGRSPSDVLPMAVTAVADGDSAQSRSGSELLESQISELGPGVEIVPATRVGVELQAVRFTVRSDHDLLKHGGIFGLTEVTRPGGHFSRISPEDLWVDQARQSAVAIFSALGFEAAAVTAIGLRMVSLPVRNARGLAVTFDRPFGFLTVHRPTGLVLFAGWVDSPAPWSPPS